MARRILVFIFVTLVALLGSVPSAQAAANPLTCAGYAETRVFIDSQSWWLPLPGQKANSFGHLHAATCFPLQQRVKGVVPLDIRLTMHDNPGKLVDLTIQMGQSGQTVVAKKTFSTPLTCPMGTTCIWWVHLDANTSLFATDGIHEMRIRPRIKEPDGKEMVSSTGWVVNLVNGKSISNDHNFDYTESRGWYTGADYTNARIRTGYRPGIVLKGKTAPFWIQCKASKPVTGCMVTVDPDFHSGNSGTVLLKTSGTYDGKPVLDWTRIPNGPHRLVVRTDANASPNQASGILAVQIYVQN